MLRPSTLTRILNILFWNHYLEMRYEVGRDTPLRLDSGATSLAVGLDFAIFTFKHNIKVIQNRHLRNWRHWIPQWLCSEVKINLRSRAIWVWGINLTSPLIMSAGRRVYFPNPRSHIKEMLLPVAQADKRAFYSKRESCVACTSEIGHNQATRCGCGCLETSII